MNELGLDKKLYSTTEMAEVVGVSSAYLRRLLSQGRIEGVKVGGNWAVPRAEVRRFIEERRRT